MTSFSGNHARPGQFLPYAALLLTWALVHISLVAFHDLPVFDSGLVGPDSFMRMLRVNELYQGWNWFDGTIARANAPYGDTLHWTRPFDVLLLVIALPFSLFMGYEQALYVSGIIVSPLLQLGTGLLLVWALRPVIRAEVWFLPVIALFLQPGALSYSILGRADHHSLLLLVFVIVAGFMLRALRDPLDARPALFAGVTVGFGIWLSVEFLLVMGLSLTALGLPWLFGARERASQSKWFALALSCMLLAALFAERPFARLLEPSYDRVSCVQFLLAVSILMFWRIVETYEHRSGTASLFLGRAILTVMGVGAVGLLANSVYPLFFAGPMAEVDPRIQSIWLDRVVEMQPVIPRDRSSLGTFVFYFGGGLLVAPFFLATLLGQRGSERFWALLFIAIGCLLMASAATRHMRFSGYAEIAFIMAFAVVLDRFLQWSAMIRSDLARGLLRGAFISAIMLGPILIGSALMTKDAEAKDAAGQPLAGCSVRQIAAYLELDPRWSAQPQTILTVLDIGPELLYRTRHAVIGTPYHRNADGIFDSHRILTTGDDALARDMIDARGVDLVLLCQSQAERLFFTGENGEASLYGRLNGGHPPAWLEQVDLPPALEGQARLYAVTR